MAQITLTNTGTTAVLVQDIYTSVPGTGTKQVVFDRPMSALPAMKSMQAAIAAGSITMSIVPTADEVASGLLSPPNAVGADDLLAVAAATVAAPLQTMRIPLASGGASGTADVVTVYAVNALPYKFRVLDLAIAFVSTNFAGSSMTVDTIAAGGGTLVATLDTATTGRKVSTSPVSSVVVTPGALAGLFVRRSDRSVVGEIVMTIRRES